MNGEWDRILSGHPDIDPELLTAYLEGRLTGEERHRVERSIAASDFVADAVEGLSAVPDPSRLPGIVADLNRGLRRRTRERRRRLFRNGMDFPLWLAYATALVIILVTVAWVVLRMLPAARG
jgi:anti-sigma factor RsiW